MMKLIPPTMAYIKEIQAYKDDFIQSEGTAEGCGTLREFDSPRDWIRYTEILKSEETVPEGCVPSTHFIYVREEDNRVAGALQIRHRLDAYRERFSGHIGYSVAPSERRKGYATGMLKAALPVCKSLGIYDVLICCLTDNEGSRRTILKNGGIYESTVYEPEKKCYLERYRIHLHP